LAPAAIVIKAQPNRKKSFMIFMQCLLKVGQAAHEDYCNHPIQVESCTANPSTAGICGIALEWKRTSQNFALV
jgi:hypothetical protein